MICPVTRTLLFSGFEVRAPQIPEDARVLVPPIPLPEVRNLPAELDRALENPEAGPALRTLLTTARRVTLVLDDPSLPVPPVSRDCRRDRLEAVLRAAARAAVPAKRFRVLVANGLSRQWRPSELTQWLGAQNTSAVPVACHDAEDSEGLLRVGDAPEGPIEVNRALVDADLVVHLNVVSTPLMAGTFGLSQGAVGYRTTRFLSAPALFEATDNPFTPGSTLHQAHGRVAATLAQRVPVFQLSAVLNSALWGPALAALLRSSAGLSRPLQMWNALPAAVRHRAARLVKAAYRPTHLFAGPPEAVAPRALKAFWGQHELATEGDADVLVFGLPDQGPGSVHASQNPVLAAHLALAYVANLYTGRPLLRPGGILVFANPLTPAFDRAAHLPHQELYEKVLRLERDPAALAARYEANFAGRPEFVSNYQRRFSFHGAHPLHAWYQCAPARRRAARIVVPHGDPRACSRLGFTPAADVEDALEKARELLGLSHPRVTVLELPPPFWVRVR
jgi:hypothetical protein